MSDEYEVILREDLYGKMAYNMYRLTVRREEDDEGTAGVREPRRPKPLLPAATIQAEVSASTSATHPPAIP